MSYRVSQLSPQASTQGTSVRIAIRGPWSHPPESCRDVQLWRSWLEFDSEDGEGGNPRRVNWNAVLGLALMVGISVGVWTGVGLIVAYFWK
jgi:hypothetical protein